MNANQNEQRLMKKARERVGQRIGLIIHIICWLVISAVITIAVPEQSMGVRVGILVFGFWGICVVIHILIYALNSRKVARNYDSAVRKEFERMKSEK